MRFSWQLVPAPDLSSPRILDPHRWPDQRFTFDLACMCVSDSGTRLCRAKPTARVLTPMGWAAKCRHCIRDHDTPWP